MDVEESSQCKLVLGTDYRSRRASEGWHPRRLQQAAGTPQGRRRRFAEAFISSPAQAYTPAASGFVF